MPSSGSRPPRPPPPTRPKTDKAPGSRRKQSRSAKRTHSRRSAPARIEPQIRYPNTRSSFFLPLTVQVFSPNPVPPLVNPTYDEAIARLEILVADSTITVKQKLLLQAVLHTAQDFVSPGSVHHLLRTVASSWTTAAEILLLLNVVTLGMRAFVAQPGPTPGTQHSDRGSASSNISRSDRVKSACAARDGGKCVVTGRFTGQSCHIIPYSVRDDKADNFWAFVAMFKGRVATEQLKRMTLGPLPAGTDSIRNVVWLAPDVHDFFDNGQLAIVPLVAGPRDAPYDPNTVTEYIAHIEFPYGAQRTQLAAWITDPDGSVRVNALLSGHSITLRTPDPLELPLPHPILFQLHTAFSRLRKMCAAADIPFLPADSPESQDGQQEEDTDLSMSDDASQSQDDLPRSTPRFAENDLCTRSAGTPLKERFLRLLCGAEESESEQYYNIIDMWVSKDGGSSDVDMPDVRTGVQDRKRGFEVFQRDEDGGSERSSQGSEPEKSKLRLGSRWEGVVRGAGGFVG